MLSSGFFVDSRAMAVFDSSVSCFSFQRGGLRAESLLLNVALLLRQFESSLGNYVVDMQLPGAEQNKTGR